MFTPERLKELRQQKRVTQSCVAADLNLTREAYCQYESGRRRPGLETLIQLCKTLPASSDFLLDLSPVNLPAAALSQQELFILSHLRSLSQDTLDLLVFIVQQSVKRGL
ncbi:MAG: helix-turn-helix transcriptional regulator [Lachnospiraceae bacterium]|nr:helix-turn-helix transcriptional regulator [Lachnospiraceae bacterium]